MTLKTILEIHTIHEIAETEDELLEFIEEEIQSCRDKADFLGAGEWLISTLSYLEEDRVEEVVAKVIALWASPSELRILPSSIDDLILQIDEFVREDLTTAVVKAASGVRNSDYQFPNRLNDLIFRLLEPICELFELEPRKSPYETCVAATAKLQTTINGVLSAASSFTNTNCLVAKTASIELARSTRRLKKIALPAEKSILNTIDILLGPSFRKFCESCEHQDTKGIIKWAPALREQARRFASPPLSRPNSTFWNEIVEPISRQVLAIVDEGTRKSEVATTPLLRLANDVIKLDLSKCDREMNFSSRLVNEGEGLAHNIVIEPDLSKVSADLRLVEPRGSFEVGGETETIVTFGIILKERRDSVTIPVVWKCQTATGKIHTNSGQLNIRQQRVQPDWENLLEDPPYSINPIKHREKLYGRDEVLNQLLLHASSGKSTFLWGQKRVGKTSVLQVLAGDISRKSKESICIVLRVGEIGSLHEGQIAYRIAERLHSQLPHAGIFLPNEQAFGAGLGSLIPFVEELHRSSPFAKLIIVIDEFEDLNPAFYTGERGKQFVKALRSLSEVGLTFFFVGSERMKTIYSTHELDLNKWVNISLDCLESREDSKALVIQPVVSAIEYEPEAVDCIVDYCGRNPFYIHLLCSELFEHCWHLQRTCVNLSDVQNAHQTLLRTMGATNFSHFWEDNPELDDSERAKQSAENCLVLCCISASGGYYETPKDLLEMLDVLGLGVSERLSEMEILKISDRLHNRGVLTKTATQDVSEISLPIFRNWLSQNDAQMTLLSRWRQFCKNRAIKKEEAKQEEALVTHVSIIPESAFPIPEEELLSVSQSLVYCGKQKDASEIRVWLRQFDDEIRIEIAYLLLKRLAEKGFVTEGAKLVNLERLQEALKETRLKMGNRAWKVVRNRLDNLCVTFVDSDMKSGATTAREIAKRLRPGKQGSCAEIIEWMKSHVDKDPLVLLIDDFAGTGSTLVKGLNAFLERVKDREVREAFLTERRILCYVLYSFPEAVERLSKKFPEIQFLSAHIFGEDVKALDPESQILANESEISFAGEFLLQLGQELTPQMPLGYGNMAALVCFHNTVPNTTLPIFWSTGTVGGRPWKPLFPRA